MSLRLRRTLFLAAAVALGLATPAAAHRTLPTEGLDGLLGSLGTLGDANVSPGVEHLGWLSAEAGDLTPGGRLVGDRFYVTGSSHLSIYDVADPARPALESRLEFPSRFENEDVSTDGRILLYSDFATSQSLYVYDVRDPTRPELLAELPGAGRHTMECVRGCRFAYGSYRLAGPQGPLTGGEIVDLRDPAAPRVAGDWTENGVLPSARVHDVTEVSPGRVLTASDPMTLLDVSDPLKPKVLARGDNEGERLHTVEWPRAGRDRFILSSFETNATPRCEAGSGAFATWDARSRPFTRLHEFTLSHGEGTPPANVLGCSPHWFEVRPGFRDGGIVALGAYDHGLRFLEIGPGGEIAEVGHFLPPGAETSAAYWITDEILYTVDYTRGIDIVRFKR
jgi:hypothetical protein